MSAYLTYTDEELLSLLNTSDEAAFNEIFRRYRDKLFFYLRKHTKSNETAEEIVTDIFMKLWAGRELTARIDNLAAFLHKVGYYKTLDFLRTTARHQRLQQTYIDYFLPPGEKPADEALIDSQDRLLLYKAILQLPPRRQTIYKMSREEGLSHDQIAEALGLSRSTVNNQLGAATRSIAEYLRSNTDWPKALSVLFFLG